MSSLRDIAKRYEKEAVAVLVTTIRDHRTSPTARSNAARQLLELADAGEAQIKMPWEYSDHELDTVLRACEARGLVSEKDLAALEAEDAAEEEWVEPELPADVPLPSTDDARDVRAHMRAHLSSQDASTGRLGEARDAFRDDTSSTSSDETAQPPTPAGTSSSTPRRRAVLDENDKPTRPTTPTEITIMVSGASVIYAGRRFDAGWHTLPADFVLNGPLRALVTAEERGRWGIV